MSRGVLKELSEEDDRVISVIPIWEDITKIQNCICELEDEDGQIDIELKIIGFSSLFNQSETGQNIMAALSSTSDLTVFTRSVVTTLVDYKWNNTRRAVV